jgi:dTDP-4-amino-4,6-dideoxygalactose transaminase
MDFLSKKGVGTILQWGGYALHQFKELGLTGNLDYTESMTKKFMLLPLYPTLTDEEVLYICKQIKLFYNY